MDFEELVASFHNLKKETPAILAEYLPLSNKASLARLAQAIDNVATSVAREVCRNASQDDAAREFVPHEAREAMLRMMLVLIGEHTALTYISKIPKQLPAGRIMVHNHIRPQRIGRNGFRVWLDAPCYQYERCPCAWAGGVEHYRVRDRWTGDEDETTADKKNEEIDATQTPAT